MIIEIIAVTILLTWILVGILVFMSLIMDPYSGDIEQNPRMYLASVLCGPIAMVMMFILAVVLICINICNAFDSRKWYYAFRNWALKK